MSWNFKQFSGAQMAIDLRRSLGSMPPDPMCPICGKYIPDWRKETAKTCSARCARKRQYRRTGT